MNKPAWKYELFYCAWLDNTDGSKLKARLNSCSAPSVGEGISRKNPGKGIVI